MIHSKGRKRVVITNVTPRVLEGHYPAKATIGEELLIGADVFCDGHDEIAVRLFIKHESKRSWEEYVLEPLGNDHWAYRFTPADTGTYSFQIKAWVDHFKTWKTGLEKKIEAGHDTSIDFRIGAELIEKAANASKGTVSNMLLQAAATLVNSPDKHALSAYLDEPELAETISKTVDKEFITAFPETLQILAERKKASFSTWYELFPRSAGGQPGVHGNFQDVQRLLPRIAAMGFDTLYLPPIHPIGKTKRKGKNNALVAKDEDPGSPWAIGGEAGGHKSIHPQLGTLRDFKALVKAARKHDIEIAMDIAFQCSPDHPYVKEHPQWFKWRPDGSVQYAENPPKKYEDILPLDFETDDWQNLWQELKSVILFWIGQGVNIFRVDNPHTKSFPFWEWVIPAIRKEHPEVIFLAEAFTRPRLMEQLAIVGFNQSYTYFTWRNSKRELETYIRELTGPELRYYFRPNFWPNTPDILTPELTYGGENAHILKLILAATLSGNYGIYGPVYEMNLAAPMPGKEEYIDNEKYEIRNWDWQQTTRTGEVISLVNRIRKANSSLQTAWNTIFLETSNEQIIGYAKTDQRTGNYLLVFVNLDPHHTQSAQVRIPWKDLGLASGSGYRMDDLLSGDSYHWSGEWNFVMLNPYEMPAHILKITPDTTTYEN